ncbi:tyrosyl-DNA phosphodiesterase-domain-containing protein [Mycena alexandri]|uniref:Tyrosyl-DNA phosphodiesterase-domain-containing protein n=1 Tax=Mycena alexandri TaxID=1745969 RepID=A0AAD6X5T5_9AGAR|nr:tyrosyl-DNA phosphodiesterase-domain-containing protein [Mycena alexandri]
MNSIEGRPAQGSVRAIATSSKAQPSKPIVIEDSETEDDSDNYKMPLVKSSHKAKVTTPPTVSGATRRPHTTSDKPIVIDDSETDDDSSVEELSMRKKSSSSLKPTKHASTAASTPSASSVSPGKRTEPAPIPSLQSSSLGSLPDRAQMEAERLARRKRLLLDDEAARDSKRQRTSGATVSIATKTTLATRMFYDGAFFPTATVHANPRADGREAIRFEDIVGKSELKLAILSTYTLDPDWLALHFDSDIPVIVVAGTGSEENGPSMSRLFRNPNWIQTCPKVGKGGCFHMKYMVLCYKSGRLRVVVSTANLLLLDWEHLENAVFIQDVLPRSSSNVIGDNLGAKKESVETQGGFSMVLENVLKATNVGPALESLRGETPDLSLKYISDISRLWNWSNVTAELVPSIAGKWEGWKKIQTTGHPRLMCALKTLDLATNNTQKLIVECQGSSIGTYTTQWFNQFYISATGHSSALKSHMRLSERERKKLEYPTGVKVVFPTLATVKGTGQHGAGSLFCTRKKWDVKSFPRDSFHDSKSSAGRVLMHTKMVIGSFTQKRNTTADPSDAAGWMYVGSHNFTAAAWGNLSGSADAPVLNVNNYELGVVIPLRTVENVNSASAWERPPRKYAANDIPWIQEENH